MLYSNALLFTPSGWLSGGFSVENGRFVRLLSGLAGGEGEDLHGAKVLPGLVDIHIHGGAGADCSDGDEGGLERLARFLARSGVTAFAPTTMTLPYERLSAAFAAVARFREHRPHDCARPVGIHMEGPFLAPARKGAQNGDYLRDPDSPALRRLYELCGGLVRLVDVAPELPGAEDFIRQASGLCTVSVAHTGADYAQAKAAFAAGAAHVTHLFNAMPPIHHRSPGVIGAASEEAGVTAELICDGWHVHPSAVRMAFRLFPGRICLISDALRCCGMPEGAYELGGQQVYLRGGVARLADGTLAGAASTLFQDLRNAVRFGIPEAEAIRAATCTPAAVIGAGDVGAIQPGNRADFLICSHDLELQAVVLAGQRVQ